MKENCLYLVATPIGNLGDMTVRAVEILKTVDFVAAEDTRVTMRLFNHFDISKPLISYYEHNKRERGQLIVDRILAGESCALVSDAGTPAISDPGEDLVELCIENGIEVIPIPGACAGICAIIASGLPTGRFTFEGFISKNKKQRIARLSELKNEQRTMVFYESPHKLTDTLKSLYDNFGDRRLTICRELTKLHEEKVYTTTEKALTLYEEKAPRGEFVLVLEGAQPIQEENDPEAVKDDAQALVRELIDGGMSLKDTAKRVSEMYGMSKNDAYKLALDVSNKE